MGQRKQKIFVFLYCLFLFLCMPSAAYAEETDAATALINEYKAQIEKVIADLEAEELIDDAAVYRKAMEQLESIDFEEITTIRGGYEVIDKITCEIDAFKTNLFDTNATGFKSRWKERFRKKAESYGIEMGTLTADYDDGFGNDVYVGSQSTEADELKNASVKVNILTWNKSDGLKSRDQGAIAKILRNFDAMDGFTTWVQGIAIALTITFGCTTLLTMCTDKNLSTEALQREFLKILFGVWFIMNYKFFTILLIRLGSIITERVLDFSGGLLSYQVQYVKISSWDSLSQMAQEFPKASTAGADLAAGAGNLGAGLMASVSNAVGALSNFLGGGIIQITSSLIIYVVAIEIGVRYIFTPVAIADLYSEKFRSNGWMYLKKLFACSMQGAVVFMIIYAVNALKISLATFDPITLTAINLTMIGMFAKSRQIANDAIGVH